ncbi:response regulator [Desulfoluna spongiiphila]|uniref:Response regulator receiver domain-containing protein n=1 Tax=Desulfoluna spongiiphila TaxID=419481 RepID=A0A1G5I7F8_9BACT|nr:response regulator [Desulfoluna spongiiphila]SCY71934.1 Response regulator receiver domain-containing protein [Desulfoluna spongiiphila]VVS93235.1 signal transduction response regulator receiver domain [Desulfoluna spongiiphila]
MNNKVVFVDDEKPILDSITRAFRNEPYKIYAFDDPSTALEEIHVIKPAVVISDRMMPAMDGSEFLEKIRIRWPSVVRIMLTGHSDIDATITVINKGHIFRFINKPWSKAELKMSVKNGVDHFNLAMENKQMSQVIKQKNEALLALNNEMEGRLRSCLSDVEETGKQYRELNRRLQETLTAIITDIEQAKGS